MREGLCKLKVALSLARMDSSGSKGLVCYVGAYSRASASGFKGKMTATASASYRSCKPVQKARRPFYGRFAGDLWPFVGMELPHGFLEEEIHEVGALIHFLLVYEVQGHPSARWGMFREKKASFQQLGGLFILTLSLLGVHSSPPPPSSRTRSLFRHAPNQACGILLIILNEIDMLVGRALFACSCICGWHFLD